MILTIFTTIGVNFMFGVFYATIRCFDRGCRCDSHYTSKLTQYDYEDVNTGNIFSIDQRYSGIITYVFVVMTYSGSMPILYPIAAVFFFLCYWNDKVLMIYFYRKPPMFDNSIALKML